VRAELRQRLEDFIADHPDLLKTRTAAHPMPRPPESTDRSALDWVGAQLARCERRIRLRRVPPLPRPLPGAVG
jgi:hypothetical protein